MNYSEGIEKLLMEKTKLDTKISVLKAAEEIMKEAGDPIPAIQHKQESFPAMDENKIRVRGVIKGKRPRDCLRSRYAGMNVIAASKLLILQYTRDFTMAHIMRDLFKPGSVDNKGFQTNRCKKAASNGLTRMVSKGTVVRVGVGLYRPRLQNERLKRIQFGTHPEAGMGG